jgi:hypothetical protein
VVRKDPDITFPNLFLLGEQLTRKWAKAKKGARLSLYIATASRSEEHHS